MIEIICTYILYVIRPNGAKDFQKILCNKDSVIYCINSSKNSNLEIVVNVFCENHAQRWLRSNKKSKEIAKEITKEQFIKYKIIE